MRQSLSAQFKAWGEMLTDYRIGDEIVWDGAPITQSTLVLGIAACGWPPADERSNKCVAKRWACL